MNLPDSYPKVAIVVPTYNSVADCLGCLESLMQLTYPNFEVIVVDDGSSDGTSEAIARLYPKVRILRGDGNLWWTGCMNLGSRDAVERGADYVMAMNSDVRVSPDCLEGLVHCAEENRLCVVGSLIYYKDDTQRIWSAGGVLRWPREGATMLGHGEADRGQYQGVREVEWIPGMGTLYPREILVELDCFDSKFPQYHADADLTLRARRKGYRVLVTSRSRLFNDAQKTGVGIRAEGVTWAEIKVVFTSVRSADYIGTGPRFIWRYSPRLLFLLCLAWRYAQITRAICIRLWRNVFGYHPSRMLPGSPG